MSQAAQRLRSGREEMLRAGRSVQPPVRHVVTHGPAERWVAAEHTQRGWHATYAVLVALVLVLTWPDADGAERVLLLAGAAVLLVGYVRWGLRAVENGTGAEPYAVSAVLGVALVALAGDASVLLLAAVVPQVYWVLPLRRALPAAGAVFTLVAYGLVLHGDGSAAQLAEALLVGIGGFVLSTLAAAWLAQVLAQSEARAHLIRELESTRHQLAGADYEAGVLQERTRLAGEIHDSLAQGFASIQMLLLSVERDLDAGRRDRAAGRVQLAREQAGRHLEESRSIIEVLRPLDLRRGDLVADLRYVVAGIARELEVQACLEVEGEPGPVPDDLQVVLLRVLQEALANVRKHARARTVSARLCFEPGRVVLSVHDDGVGFDPTTQTPGFGRGNMHRRAADAGGLLEVHSRPGEGTSVRLELPRPVSPDGGPP